MEPAMPTPCWSAPVAATWNSSPATALCWVAWKWWSTTPETATSRSSKPSLKSRELIHVVGRTRDFEYNPSPVGPSADRGAVKISVRTYREIGGRKNAVGVDKLM